MPFYVLAAKPTEEPWRNLIPHEMSALPEGVLKWYITETDYLSREVDPLKIASPKENTQDIAYLPESKNVFDVLGLWMPESELRTYSSPSSSGGEGFKKRFTRTRNGKTEVLFLIHPESLDLYRPWIDAGYEREYFKAAATASSRSLLVWQVGQEQNPLIAKLSLNKIIAKANRGVRGAEVAKSIGTSATLEGSKNLPANFLYMKESFGAIPNGLERGGMILREFPIEMKDSKSHFIPLFALYGDKKPGFLLWALQNSPLPAKQLVTEQIIRPFAKLWTELALKHGILIEPHAQNVLVEIRDGKLTGRFVMRDFGGFTIDFEFRKQQHLFVPEKLPTFEGSVFEDYSLKYYAHNIRASLAIFFEGGFLYNIEKALKTWQNEKWIPSTSSFNTSAVLKQEITQALETATGQKAVLGDYFAGIDEYILKNRSLHKPNKPRRIGFFSGTFDPPHEGHRDLIERSIRELHLDAIVIAAGIQQDHKPGALSHTLRERMAKAAFADIPQAIFLTESQLSALAEGGIPSLQKKLSIDFADARVYQIMGDDSLERLQNNPKVSFPDNFIIAVGKRDANSQLPNMLHGKTPVVTLSPDYRQLSSTRFRSSLAREEIPKEIPAAVLQIMREQGLYGLKPIQQCRELFLK